MNKKNKKKKDTRDLKKILIHLTLRKTKTKYNNKKKKSRIIKVRKMTGDRTKSIREI